METNQSDYPEDDQILALLEDPTDVEAFANMMENAHRKGKSAADFVREEPRRTSRRAIRKLCLRDRRRSIRAAVASVMRSMWDRPAEDPATGSAEGLFGAQPPRFGSKTESGKQADRPQGPNGRQGST